MGAELPTLLVQAGVVTRAQLAHVSETAASVLSQLQALIREGLDPRALAGLLVAEGHGPLIEEDELKGAEAQLRFVLPKSKAVSLCAYPVKRTDDSMLVAMLDPTDSRAVDVLERELGVTVEARPALADALERALSARYTSANDNHVHRISTYVPTGNESLPPEKLAGPDTYIPTGDEQKRFAPPVGGSIPYRKPKEPPARLFIRALVTIGASRDRDRVAQVACEVAAGWGDCAYFFMMRKTSLVGWEGFGEGVHRSLVRSLMLPIDGPSLFLQALDAQQMMVGKLGSTGTDAVYRATVGSAGESVGIAPIVVNGMVAALLCSDGFDPQHTTDLEKLAEAMSSSFAEIRAKAS